jgi:hypothetical protein
MTLRSGLHYGVEADDYYADPCEEPSLTQSIAKIMLRQSPAHARLAHPRLNPGKEERDPTKYDIGHIAHRLLLGRGREVEIIDAKDWRTKGAKEAREVAREAGRLGVLSQDWDRASDMTGAVLAQLRERGYGPDWEGLDVERCAEVVAIARSTTFSKKPIWLRCMIDWLPSLTRPWDLKTTARSAAPDELWRHLVDADWPIQAAMHERILDHLDPGGAGRRGHRFVVVENSPPYAMSIVRMSEAHMTIGRAQLDRAEAIWTSCMAADRWPAYPLVDQNPEYPAWRMKAEMLPEAE